MKNRKLILACLVLFAFPLSLFAQTWVTSAMGMDLECIVITSQQYQEILNNYKALYPYANIQYTSANPFGFGQNYTNSIRPSKGSIPKFQGYFYVFQVTKTQSPVIQNLLDEAAATPSLTYGNERTGYMSIEFYPFISKYTPPDVVRVNSNDYTNLFNLYIRTVNAQ